MKLLAVLAGTFLICAIGATPVDVPAYSSEYVEGESRYVWLEYDDEDDGSCKTELVDLEAPINVTSAHARNGNNNAYYLFTRSNRNNGQPLRRNDINSVRNSNYRGNRGTVVIVHGWNGKSTSSLNTRITGEFLNEMDVNVIVVDWRRAATGTYSYQAAPNVASVGEHLGDFLIWLFNSAGGSWDNLHLVGHSLGAHVVGVAGRRTGSRPRRITGLDPAGPHWGGNGRFSSHRLRSNAGRYVEAIHTDGGRAGIMDRIAHADFYPNGGRRPQPNCWTLCPTCSHSRAHELFAASIRNRNRFEARRCDNQRQAERNECNGSRLLMGNGILSKSGNGYFGLRTGGSWPF